MQGNSELDRFFRPDSVAIIGASRNPGKAGNVILENIIANDYQGRLYPVNPNVDGVLGLRCYPSVRDLPEAPDLAILAVPAAGITAAIQDCAQKGVRALVATTSGFAEVDRVGADLQQEILTLARRAGIRIMGPNTSGITSTPHNLVASIYPLGKLKKGSVSVISQTGNFATHTMRWMLTGESLGICRFAGLGNKIDVDEAELLEYFGNDPATKAVAMYLEGFKNAKGFLHTARRVCRVKPLIALKSGRTTSGIRAVASHTASLASNDTIVDATFRQAGVVRLTSYIGLVDTIKLLSFQPVPSGNRVAVLTPSGAMGIVAADACERLGLRIAELSPEAFDKLSAIFPDYVNVGNPIDIWGAALVHGVYQAYRTGMQAALEDDGIDVVYPILTLSPRSVFSTEEFDPEGLSFIPELSRQYPHKVVMVGISGDKAYYEVAKKYLEERSIPVYLPVEPALEALAYVSRCRQYMDAV